MWKDISNWEIYYEINENGEVRCDRVFNEREAHRLNIKEYKPFKVYFQNGEYKEYEFAIDLANELKVTKRTIQNYLQGKSNSYKSRGINEIKYL